MSAGGARPSWSWPPPTYRCPWWRSWRALFGIPVLAVLNTFFNYAIDLSTIEEMPRVDTDAVLEAARREAPEATDEELVALAAQRLEREEQPGEA